ncbi:arginine--tRNA ligase [archaeon]|nr:arginine--tRNA ligase [archaeon]
MSFPQIQRNQTQFNDRIIVSLKALLSTLLPDTAQAAVSKIPLLLETPPDPALGDIALPCFFLSPAFKKSPQLIAQELASKLQEKKPKEIERVLAVNGYLNIFISKNLLSKFVLGSILKQKQKFGRGGLKEKIMIEFSQANTHKAFHVGHIRGTSIGESLARISEFMGNKVLRANYQGDTGMHVAKWLWCYLKYHKNKKLKEDESYIASIYTEAVRRLTENPELQHEVDLINKSLDEKSDKPLLSLWKKTRSISLNSLKPIYACFNTKFDIFYFEKDMEQRGKQIAQDLLKKGIAQESEGAIIVDLTSQALGILVLVRKDGTALYSAKDLALAEKKFTQFKLDKSIYIIGAAQTLYFSQLFKMLYLMDFPHAHKLKVIHFSEVRLPSGKMSSRTGENILYSDFKEEITKAAQEQLLKRFPSIKKKELDKRALAISIASIKYNMLRQDANKSIIFKKEEALSFEGDTGPYLLYSYARASAILRKAHIPPNFRTNSIITTEKIEFDLIKHLADFPCAIQSAYTHLEPSIIANYASRLAQLFNEFYHACPVLHAEKAILKSRLALVLSFTIILKQALYLLGIKVLEKM